MYGRPKGLSSLINGDVMADITMCAGADEKRNLVCPMRDKCHRFTAKANEYRQAYFTVVPYEDPECAEFWDNKGRNE